MPKTEHHWAKIAPSLWVSLDAYKVDGVRRRFTPPQAREMAASLGARLPTAAELDQRWSAAGLHNIPHTLPYKTKGDQKHSALVDADIPDDYEWIIGNTGKHWVSDQLASGARALYGWHYDESTRHLKAAPIYPAETIDDAWVIQRVTDSSHNDAHTDYSMTGVFARVAPPAEWWEIGDDGYVRWLVHESPNDLNVAAKPLRLRALEWSRSMVGHRETAPNTSALIDKWAERCTRNGVSMGPLWSKATGLDWCAVFATGGAHGEVLSPDDPEPPCGMRVSGKELLDDARERGTLVTPDELFAGLYDLRAGDIVVWKRFDPGTTQHTWLSHVCRFVEWKDRAKWLPVTVDGNSANMVRQVDNRTLRSGAGLWGIIRYFDDDSERPRPSQPKSVAPTPSTPPVVLNGIDVSHHQLPARMNWRMLAQDNQFVIARCSYGTRADKAFVDHIRAARAAGMSVGAYHFFRHQQDREAQLGTILAQLEAASFDEGDIATFVDLEGNVKNDGPITSVERYNDDAQWLTEQLAARHGVAGIYTERDFWRDSMAAPDWAMRHPVWTSWPFTGPPWPDNYAIWQHSHTSRHAAYPVGPLDANRARMLPRIT